MDRVEYCMMYYKISSLNKINIDSRNKRFIEEEYKNIMIGRCPITNRISIDTNLKDIAENDINSLYSIDKLTIPLSFKEIEFYNAYSNKNKIFALTKKYKLKRINVVNEINRVRAKVFNNYKYSM